MLTPARTPEVLRHYGPAYLTAVGTMSSAATLGVALECARKSKVLRKDMVSFGIPLFANIHLCGSVLTVVFFCMTVSKILYGKLPSVGTMILFCLLLMGDGALVAQAAEGGGNVEGQHGDDDLAHDVQCCYAGCGAGVRPQEQGPA